jgi:hypothetical protein
MHFGGHAHFGGGMHVGIRVPHVNWGWSRPRYSVGPRIRVTGGIWLGGGYNYGGYYYNPGFAEPPPPAPTCECGPTAYPPVYPGTTTYAAVAAPIEPPLPRFGVGLFAGGVNDANGNAGSDVGLLARFRLSRGLILEGELGKSETANGARVDRRGEASLIWELGAEHPWAPYVLAGFGGTRADTVDVAATQGFGEIGAGLRWAITPRLHLTADFRAGSRDTVSGGVDTPTGGGTLARTIAPPTANGNAEQYTRMRLGAVVYF